jgi:hypothetical protein
MKDELATGLWEILIELLIVSIIIELSLSLYVLGFMDMFLLIIHKYI